jgi:hypothetical protein
MGAMSTSQETTTTPTTPQNITIPFTSRDQPGKITVTVQANHDPHHAAGLDLIFPQIPQKDFPKQFHGFPVTKATIEYPLSSPSPASLPESYASLFGWIQFVKAIPVDITHNANNESGQWEMDIYPYASDLNSPFAVWGFNPTLFDAPARLLGPSSDDGKKVGSGDEDEPEELVWRAQSFLCVLEDAGITKRVQLIEGSGF